MLARYLLIALGALLFWQQPPPAPITSRQPIQVKTEEVLVDVIVVDSKGKPVLDLKSEDFEIYEDGARQQIVSFRTERGTAPGAEPAAAPVTPTAPQPVRLRDARLISLVFDMAATQRDSLSMVRTGALDFISGSLRPEDFVAVFSIGSGLQLLQPFTQDTEALKKAIETAATADGKRIGLLASETRRRLEKATEGIVSNADAAALGEAALQAQTPEAKARAEDPSERIKKPESNPIIDPSKLLAYSSFRILRTFDRYDREYQGRQSISGLLAIIEVQRIFPGRKTLIYFSEGFPVASTVAQEFRSVISAANRASTAVYSIDAAGLRSVNPNAVAEQDLQLLSQGRSRNTNPDLVVGGQSSLGRLEESARLNTQNTLSELSDETGGYVIKNTNDMRDGLRRIREDLLSYYILSYTPANQNFDGKFRTITVKVSQPNLRVRSRSGYYAFRSLDEVPLFGYEARLMEALLAEKPPADFDLQMTADHFPEPSGQLRIPFFLQFPGSAFQTQTDTKTKNVTGRYSVMVLARDKEGQIALKRSRRYTFGGTLQQAQRAQQGALYFDQTLMLSPGSYQLETVVRDEYSGKTAVHRIPLELPAVSDEQLRISSIVLSRAVVPLSAEDKKNTEDPYQVDGTAKILPLSPPLFRKSTDSRIILYFTAYSAKNAAPPDKAVVDFVRDGNVTARAAGQLTPPDAQGKIKYITTFPLSSFDAGKYEVRVTIKDVKNSVVESTPFEIIP